MKQVRYAIGSDFSYGCNICCDGCSVRKQKLRSPRELSLEQGISRIDIIKSLGFMYLVSSSSETTLWKPLPKVVSYTAQQTLQMGIITNGSTLKPDLIERLNPLNRLVVSIDSMHYEAIERRKQFDPSLINYEVALQNLHRSEYGKPTAFGRRVAVNSTVSKKDAVEFKSDKSFLLLLASQLTQYANMIYRWNIIPLSDGEQTPSPSEFDEVFSKLSNEFESSNIKVDSRFPKDHENHWPHIRTDNSVWDMIIGTDAKMRIEPLGSLDELEPLREKLIDAGFLS